MVDATHTLALIKLAKQGDNEAKNELINQNYPLVKSVIRRYKNKGVDYDDLFQLGCVGFVKAINNFDESYNVRFSTYAVPMIAGEVKRFLRDDGYIKVSRAIKSLAMQIKKWIDEQQKIGVNPDIEEIAKHFEIEPQEVVFALDSGVYPVSLSSTIDSSDEQGATLQDKIADETDSEQMIDHFVLKQLIQDLEPRERKIIIMRYYRDKTQSEIAKELGVSQVQVSRLENKIIENMKNVFLSKKNA
ncbi:MAG: SigB/SigF/SigG family RNA polymerase sigma factor [Clostridia bacterium]|nr:SigB/SigF/SigG family RNA polymerase sigma factor [Clostridia bacterium]